MNMQITGVETFVVGNTRPDFGGPNWVFVKLSTDEDIVGWGECAMIKYRRQTLLTLFEELGERFLVGFDPFSIEELRARLYRGELLFQVPGILHSQFIGAIEIACWDIIGKALGEPIYNLLGGNINEKLRTYTYLHYRWDPPESPERAAEAAKEYVDMGFSGVKVDPLHPMHGPRNLTQKEMQYGEDVISSIRREIGDEGDIMIGTHGQLTSQSAIRFAKRIEEFDPLWFEEPVPMENIREMSKVADSTTIPIATGERYSSIHQFAELIQGGGAQILQPDISLLGFLEMKKIAGMGEAHYLPIAPHHYGGPIHAAASVQLAASIPNFLVLETVEGWEGVYDDLVSAPFEWDGGVIIPSNRPGLGVQLDEEVLGAYSETPLPDPWDRRAYTIDLNEER